MLIETTQLKEKLEDKYKKETFGCTVFTDWEKIQTIRDLWRLERIEELFIKYFMSEEK